MLYHPDTKRLSRQTVWLVWYTACLVKRFCFCAWWWNTVISRCYCLSHDVVSHVVDCGIWTAHCKGFTSGCVPTGHTHTHTHIQGQKRLNPNNINGDNGIQIPEAWLPMSRKHNNRQTMGTVYLYSKDWNAPITDAENQQITASITLCKVTQQLEEDKQYAVEISQSTPCWQCSETLWYYSIFCDFYIFYGSSRIDYKQP